MNWTIDEISFHSIIMQITKKKKKTESERERETYKQWMNKSTLFVENTIPMTRYSIQICKLLRAI